MSLSEVPARHRAGDPRGPVIVIGSKRIDRSRESPDPGVTSLGRIGPGPTTLIRRNCQPARSGTRVRTTTGPFGFREIMRPRPIEKERAAAKVPLAKRNV
jgi:hypothetical protein